MSDPALFDRALILARKRRAAALGGDGAAFLLDRVAEDLSDRLSLIRRTFPAAVNLGAFDGTLSRALRALPGVGLVIDAEPSPELLARAAGPRVVADEELLPFRPGSLDLVVSGLSLQLVNDVPGALLQIRRALKPDGLFLAAVLGARSLEELREAFLVAESETAGGVSPRVAPFADVREYGGLLQRAGFALPVADQDLVRVGYASPLHLMRDLRAMGAANPLRERSRRPLSRATLARAVEIYAARHGRADGRVTATFEIVTLTGWAPDASQQQPLQPGSARVSLAEALRPGVGPAPGDDPQGA